MRTSPLLLVALVSMVLAAPALAEQSGSKLDGASKQALDETQKMMTNPALRQKELDADPRAKAVDAQARAVVGEENAGAVYELASELMGTLAEEAGGDPAKLLQLIDDLQKHPEKMAGKLTPEQMAKLKGIAGRVPAAAPQKKPSP